MSKHTQEERFDRAIDDLRESGYSMIYITADHGWTGNSIWYSDNPEYFLDPRNHGEDIEDDFIVISEERDKDLHNAMRDDLYHWDEKIAPKWPFPGITGYMAHGDPRMAPVLDQYKKDQVKSEKDFELFKAKTLLEKFGIEASVCPYTMWEDTFTLIEDEICPFIEETMHTGYHALLRLDLDGDDVLQISELKRQ